MASHFSTVLVNHQSQEVARGASLLHKLKLTSVFGGEMQNWIKPTLAFSALLGPPAPPARLVNTSPLISSVSSTVPLWTVQENVWVSGWSSTLSVFFPDSRSPTWDHFCCYILSLLCSVLPFSPSYINSIIIIKYNYHFCTFHMYSFVHKKCNSFVWWHWSPVLMFLQ